MKKERVKTALLKLFGIAGAAVLAYGGLTGLFGVGGEHVASAQNDAYLSRRIDQIENRFYGLESRLGRLESASRPSIVSPHITGTNDLEIQNLRSQVELLRIRLGEVECGVLRLDERTLTPAARAARNKTAPNAAPCRQEPGTPVKLSARP